MPRKTKDHDFDNDPRVHPDQCDCGGYYRPARPPGRDDDLADHGIYDEDAVFADDPNLASDDGPTSLDNMILR